MTTGKLGSESQHSQSGQSYLAAVSDLVSALIFVFIIMLAVFAYQLASLTEDLDSSEVTRERILRDIQRRLTVEGMSVEIVPRQGVLRLSDNAINFPSGSEIPNVEHHDNVGRLARAIAAVVPCYVASADGPLQTPESPNRDSLDQAVVRGSPPAYCHQPANPDLSECRSTDGRWRLETLLIEGHTDHVPVASGNRFRSNVELSSIRAATVHRMISECEPRVESLFNSERYQVLSVSGYGSTRPVTRDPGRVQENRRIDLRFLMEPPTATAQRELEIGDEIHEYIGGGEP